MRLLQLRNILLAAGFVSSLTLMAQKSNYLHTQGKYVYDAQGNEVILRGIGTGNWLIQEGYMMKSSDVANTQTTFRKKLASFIGETRTNQFYESWLNNHFTRTDVDSMKAWGFNSIRVAMHYKWLTLPIEDEPVAGQDTWLEDGFVRLDSLLAWCSDNQMYLILDLHGAPGGQGSDAAISDYDPSKPSLWESAENKRKTVALWGKLAERYANQPWIGGYDVLNEPNWDLPGGTALKNLYVQITNKIREYDQNHILIFEGNWFANDYTGLTPAWDDNMVYSGHKYWTYNDAGALNYLTNLRNNNNVPVWLGESGENSNTWFTNLIQLCEENHVGWSWWPVKKAGINNILQVHESTKYNNLISYWSDGSPAMTADQAFEAVMEWSENHRFGNCDINYDVIDAMIRQPFSNETKPFVNTNIGDTIFAVNYDLGRYNRAYWDTDSANYHLSTDTYVNWNQGWVYRNDGIDIETCTDNLGKGLEYNVGWTADGEWQQYTITADSTAAYTLEIRSASGGAGSTVHIEIDGTDATGPIKLNITGGWQTWQTQTFSGIVFPKGEHKIKFVWDKGNSNLHFIRFTNPVDASAVSFKATSASSSNDGYTISINLNKEITAFAAEPANFNLDVDGETLALESAEVGSNSRQVVLKTAADIYYGQTIKVSYSGSNIWSVSSTLDDFTNLTVKNNLPTRYSIPGKIEAENYYVNQGLVFETCDEGGLNSGYAAPGDYLDYLVYVKTTGSYKFTFRIATTANNCRLDLKQSTGNDFTTVGTLAVQNTGGWQTWKDQSIEVDLQEGYQTLRLYFAAGEFNVNYFKASLLSSISPSANIQNLEIYPNPSNGKIKLQGTTLGNFDIEIKLSDISGKVLFTKQLNKNVLTDEWLDFSMMGKGIYLLNINTGHESKTIKLILN